MSDLTFRPRFRIETELSTDIIEEMINTKLTSDNPEGFGSTFTPGHFILRIHPSKKHFWSPQMDISIQPDDDSDHTIVRCLNLAKTFFNIYMH